MVKAKYMSKKGSKDISAAKSGKRSISSSKLKDMAGLAKYYDIPLESLTYNAIIHKMSEILEIYLKTLQQVLQPEEFHAIYECNTFTEKDKSGVLGLYRRMMLAHRELLKAVIINEEENSLSTIQFVHREILDVKTDMLEVVKKMQQSWDMTMKDSTGKQMHYFG